MDSITPFGRKWEIRHSLWLNWLLGPFLLTAFISFLYIGIRANQKKWLVAAAIYFALMAQYFFYFSDYDIDSTAFDLSLLLNIVGWIVAWIHAFQARREYLRILATNIINDPTRQTPAYQSQTTYPFPDGGQHVASIKQIKKKKTPLPVTNQKEPFHLNINQASLQEIASHPYIGNMLARQIVQIREQVGSFQSFDHFIQETKMKPHVIAKAKPYLTFRDNTSERTPSKPAPTNGDKTNSDEPKKKEPISGRIVDY